MTRGRAVGMDLCHFSWFACRVRVPSLHRGTLLRFARKQLPPFSLRLVTQTAADTQPGLMEQGDGGIRAALFFWNEDRDGWH